MKNDGYHTAGQALHPCAKAPKAHSAASGPEKLIEQLKDGGEMIVPIGAVNSVQSLKNF